MAVDKVLSTFILNTWIECALLISGVNIIHSFTPKLFNWYYNNEYEN